MKFKGDRPESSEVESEKYETKTDTTEMTEVKQDINLYFLNLSYFKIKYVLF